MKPTVVTSALALVAAFALGITPRAKADAKVCSDATLSGHHFAYTSTGSIVSAPIASIVGPYAEVGVQYFDGQGNVTFRFNASQNGAVGPATATGTYTVNNDCTGTFTETSDGFTSHFSFVTSDNGNEFHAICQDEGVVITRSGRRQF
jgi:hypothetical protein